jgi:mannose-6-phosphate isomerase-like protein (cupin superfamily)
MYQRPRLRYVPPSVPGLIVSESFVIANWTAGTDTGPERPIAPMHVHHSDDEVWIVQTGMLGVRLGDTVHEVPAGESILAPRGIPHAYWNASSEPSRYILVMTPRLHHLIEALHSGEHSDYAQVFRDHDSELL